MSPKQWGKASRRSARPSLKCRKQPRWWPKHTEENRVVVADLAERTVGVSRSAADHASSSEEVSAAAEEQSASTEDMASSASELLDASSRLSKLVEGFRT